MSKFYGQVEGMSQTVATRRGGSYIKSSVQSWDGSITMEMSYQGEELMLKVMHDDGSSFSGDTVYDGTVDNFLKILHKM